MSKYMIIILFTGLGLQGFTQENKLLSISGLGTDKLDDIDKHVVPTNDGGAIVRITSISATSRTIPSCRGGMVNDQVLFRKFNAFGNCDWDRWYPSGDSGVLYLFPDGQGGFYTINAHYDKGNFWFLAREDSSQKRIWSADSSYGGGYWLQLQSVCSSDDGGFFLAFTSYYAEGDVTVHYGSNSWSDIWVLKLDSMGKRVWSRTVGGSYVDDVARILPSPGGGCYVVGKSESIDYDVMGGHGFFDCFVGRLDGNGNLIWGQCYGGSNTDIAYDATFDLKGNLLIAGSTMSNNGQIVNFHGVLDYLVMNISPSGNLIWTNCFGSPTGEGAWAICQAHDGQIWMTGGCGYKGGQVYTDLGDTLHGNSWTICIDSMGGFLSSKVLGAKLLDRGTMVYALQGGTVMAGGYYEAGGTVGGEFPSNFVNYRDVFIAIIAPWTTGVEIKNKSVKCKVYPNPVSVTLYVEMQEQEQTKFDVRLTDANGKTIYSVRVRGNDKLSIPIAHYSGGVYELNIVGKQANFSEKIVLK